MCVGFESCTELDLSFFFNPMLMGFFPLQVANRMEAVALALLTHERRGNTRVGAAVEVVQRPLQ